MPISQLNRSIALKGLRALAIALVAGLLLASCSGDSTEQPTSTPVADVDELLETITSSDEPEFEAVDEIIDIGAEAVPGLLEIVDSDEFSVRWSSVYALGLIRREASEKEREDISSALSSTLDDESLTIRTIAAGLLTSEGVTEALPVLIAALGEDGALQFSEPPKLIRDYAFNVLTTYTGETFAFDPQGSPSARAAPLQEWEQWWEDNSSTLEWSEEILSFVIDGRS